MVLALPSELLRLPDRFLTESVEEVFEAQGFSLGLRAGFVLRELIWLLLSARFNVFEGFSGFFDLLLGTNSPADVFFFRTFLRRVDSVVDFDRRASGSFDLRDMMKVRAEYMDWDKVLSELSVMSVRVCRRILSASWIRDRWMYSIDRL